MALGPLVTAPLLALVVIYELLLQLYTTDQPGTYTIHAFIRVAPLGLSVIREMNTLGGIHNGFVHVGFSRAEGGLNGSDTAWVTGRHFFEGS
jgi:hypothetical protein